jgi:hypothetical protein
MFYLVIETIEFIENPETVATLFIKNTAKLVKDNRCCRFWEIDSLNFNPGKAFNHEVH